MYTRKKRIVCPQVLRSVSQESQDRLKETVTRSEEAIIATRVRTSTWSCFHCGKIEGVVRSPARDRLLYRRRVKKFEAPTNGADLARHAADPVFLSQRLTNKLLNASTVSTCSILQMRGWTTALAKEMAQGRCPLSVSSF